MLTGPQRRAIQEPRRIEYKARFKAEVWDKMDLNADNYIALQKALWNSCTENALKGIAI